MPVQKAFASAPTTQANNGTGIDRVDELLLTSSLQILIVYINPPE